MGIHKTRPEASRSADEQSVHETQHIYIQAMSFVKILAGVCFLFALTGETNGMVETVMPMGHMVCRPVSEVFGTLDGAKNKTDKEIDELMKGPKGNPGSDGKKGFTGPRGEEDLGKVSQIFDERTTLLKARLKRLEAEYRALKESGVSGIGSSTGYTPPTLSPNEVKNAKKCFEQYNSSISYDDKCYTFIGGEGLLWTFEAAESNCTKLGGYLADLTSRPVYDKLYDYVDKTYSTVVQAWTGMRYENDNLVQTTGEDVKFAKWMAYNPRKSKTAYSTYYKTYTYVYVKIDTSSRINGLYNAPGTRKLPFAICHFHLSGGETPRSTTKQTTTTDAYDYYYYHRFF